MSDDSSTSSQDSDELDNEINSINTPDDQWTFVARSHSGSQTMQGLPHRIYDKLSLKYDPADAHLLRKARLEIKNSLSQIRKTVFGFDNSQPITPLVAFAGVLPKQFIRAFVKWLKTGQTVTVSVPNCSLRITSHNSKC